MDLSKAVGRLDAPRNICSLGKLGNNKNNNNNKNHVKINIFIHIVDATTIYTDVTTRNNCYI